MKAKFKKKIGHGLWELIFIIITWITRLFHGEQL